MCNDIMFGGICVALFGDPGQLPCVKGYPLWCVPTGSTNSAKYRHELGGKSLFDSADDVTHLKQNLRLDPDDADAAVFNSFLVRLRNGELVSDDFDLIR